MHADITLSCPRCGHTTPRLIDRLCPTCWEEEHAPLQAPHAVTITEETPGEAQPAAEQDDAQSLAHTPPMRGVRVGQDPRRARPL